MDNEIIIHSHGAEVRYQMNSGDFYQADDGKIDLSVMADIVDQSAENGPRDLAFALTNCEYLGAGKRVSIKDRHEDWVGDDGAPHAFVYSGFHHVSIAAEFELTLGEGEQLTVEGTLVTDEVRFTGERGGLHDPSALRARAWRKK